MSEQEYRMVDEVAGKTVKVNASSLEEAEKKFDKYLDSTATGEANAEA